MVSTGDYAAFRMNMERNFAARDTAPADVDVLVKLFDADIVRTTPDLSCTRLVVCPVNSRQRIVDLIASAQKEIVVESMQLADDDVKDALVARKQAGVDVRVLLADPGWIAAKLRAADFLAAHDIPARQMKSPARPREGVRRRRRARLHRVGEPLVHVTLQEPRGRRHSPRALQRRRDPRDRSAEAMCRDGRSPSDVPTTSSLRSSRSSSSTPPRSEARARSRAAAGRGARGSRA